MMVYCDTCDAKKGEPGPSLPELDVHGILSKYLS